MSWNHEGIVFEVFHHARQSVRSRAVDNGSGEPRRSCDPSMRSSRCFAAPSLQWVEPTVCRRRPADRCGVR